MAIANPTKDPSEQIQFGDRRSRRMPLTERGRDRCSMKRDKSKPNVNEAASALSKRSAEVRKKT